MQPVSLRQTLLARPGPRTAATFSRSIDGQRRHGDVLLAKTGPARQRKDDARSASDAAMLAATVHARVA